MKNNDRFCIDCGKKLGKMAYYYNSIRCRSCAVKKLFSNPKNHPRYKHGKSLEKHYCKICNKEITWMTITKGKGLCSSCAMKQRVFTEKWRKNISKATKGSFNPNWCGGLSYIDYPIEWNEIKIFIRIKYKNICQICHKNGNFVHHIDYNKKNCKEDNLITLCNKCHSQTNFNRDYWFAYFTYIMEEIKCKIS